MHYAMPNGKLPLDPLEKFIKEMGLGTIEPENMLKVTKGNLPEETRVVVLNYQS